MKTKLRILAILLATVAMVMAATLTVDIPTADVQRVSEAFGVLYGLGHNASMAEVSEITRRWIIGRVNDYERFQYNAIFSPTPLQMQPTPTPTATATP